MMNSNYNKYNMLIFDLQYVLIRFQKNSRTFGCGCFIRLLYYERPATIAMYATPRIIIAASAKQKILTSFLCLDSIIVYLQISRF